MEWQSELESVWDRVSGLYVTGTYTASNYTRMPSNSIPFASTTNALLFVGNAAIRSGWGLGLGFRIVHTPWNGSDFDRYNCTNLSRPVVTIWSHGKIYKVPVSTRTAKQDNAMHPISTFLSLMSLQLTIPFSCPHDLLFSTTLSLHNILVTVIHYN